MPIKGREETSVQGACLHSEYQRNLVTDWYLTQFAVERGRMDLLLEASIILVVSLYWFFIRRGKRALQREEASKRASHESKAQWEIWGKGRRVEWWPGKSGGRGYDLVTVIWLYKNNIVKKLSFCILPNFLFKKKKSRYTRKMPATHSRAQTTSSFQVWLNRADSKGVFLQNRCPDLPGHPPASCQWCWDKCGMCQWRKQWEWTVCDLATLTPSWRQRREKGWEMGGQ